MKKLIALLLVIVTICMCTMPVFAAKGVKVVNKKYVSDINSGETFKYKATWGLSKPKLTINSDSVAQHGRELTFRVKVTNTKTGAVVSNNKYTIGSWCFCKTVTLPNKSANYKVQVTVLSDNAPYVGTPSFTATVNRGTLSK